MHAKIKTLKNTLPYYLQLFKFILLSFYWTKECRSNSTVFHQAMLKPSFDPKIAPTNLYHQLQNYLVFQNLHSSCMHSQPSESVQSKCSATERAQKAQTLDQILFLVGDYCFKCWIRLIFIFLFKNTGIFTTVLTLLESKVCIFLISIILLLPSSANLVNCFAY